MADRIKFSDFLTTLDKQRRAVSGRAPSRNEVAGVVAGVAETASDRLARAKQLGIQEQEVAQRQTLQTEKLASEATLQAEKLASEEKMNAERLAASQAEIDAQMAQRQRELDAEVGIAGEEIKQAKRTSQLTGTLGGAYIGSKVGSVIGGGLLGGAAGAAAGGGLAVGAGLAAAPVFSTAGALLAPAVVSAGGAAAGAAAGAQAGSIVPIVGTIIGAAIGFAIGGGSFLCTATNERVGLSEEIQAAMKKLKAYSVKNHRDWLRTYLRIGPELVSAMDKARVDFSEIKENMIVPIFNRVKDDMMEDAYKFYKHYTLGLMEEYTPHLFNEMKEAA